jgi:thioredoxin-like negative regulator of GroEL
MEIEEALLARHADNTEAAPALEALKLGKWRKARDQIKPLFKRDRSKYLDLLIAANCGLIGELMRKNLIAEARTVLDYLKTIAPPETINRLEADLLTASRPRVPSADISSAMTKLWPIAKAVLAAEGTVKDVGLLDDLVASFAPPPVEFDPTMAALAADLRAVQAACEFSSSGDWEAAAQALRSVSASSPFRHWKAFLKGLSHFFRGDQKAAADAFSRLPHGTATELAARVILGKTDATDVRSGARAAWWLACSGQPVEWASAITSASASLCANRWTDAFDSLRQSLGAELTNCGSGLGDALSDSLFLPLDPDLAEATLRQREEAFQRAFEGGPQKLSTARAIGRGFLVLEGDFMKSSDLESDFMHFLAAESKLFGADPLRDSVGLEWLGRQFLKTRPRSPFGFGREVVRDPALAKRAFEKAVEADPENQEAGQGLLQALTVLGEKSEYNRLLEKLADRFPQNKNFLVQAARACEARGAAKKAMAFAEAARKLDPLDRDVRILTVETAFRRAVALARTERSCAEIWQMMEGDLDPSPTNTDVSLARWAAHLRQRILDATTSSPPASPPSRAAALLAESFFRYLYKRPLPQSWESDWRAASTESWVGLAYAFAFRSSLLESPFFEKVLPGWEARSRNLWPKAAQLAMMMKEDAIGTIAFFETLASAPKHHGFSSIIARDMIDELQSAACKVSNHRRYPKADPAIRCVWFCTRLESGFWRSDSAEQKEIEALASCGIPLVENTARKIATRAHKPEPQSESEDFSPFEVDEESADFADENGYDGPLPDGIDLAELSDDELAEEISQAVEEMTNLFGKHKNQRKKKRKKIDNPPPSTPPSSQAEFPF